MSLIGDLRERVTLQQESRSADTGGGVVLTWVDAATLWASVDMLRGTEPVSGEKPAEQRAYRIRTRSGTAIGAEMRLVWNSRVLNIRSVRNADARGTLLEIIAEEGVAT